MKFQLLNVDANAKTVKGESKGYMTGVLYMTPSDGSGTEFCPLAQLAGCKAGCLNTAGRGGMSKGSATFMAPNGDQLPDNAVQHARLRRSTQFSNDRDAFMIELVSEIRALVNKARRKGLTPVVRLNGTSDIRWEDIPVLGYENVFAVFPDLQFYDYTKIPNRRRALGIANYHLTFSYSGIAEFAPIVVKALKEYGDKINFAAVFSDEKFPEFFLGRRVVNGDESDLRFLDPTNVVIGLKAKGRAKKDNSGFVVKAN